METSSYVIEVEGSGTIYVLYDDNVLITTKDMSEALKAIQTHYSNQDKPANTSTLGHLFNL